MRERVKFRLLVASTLCAWIAIDALLAWRGDTALSVALNMVVAVTAYLTIGRRSGQKLKPDANEPSVSENESVLAAPVRTEIWLAIEHIQSIQVLLDISRAHRQPIPNAVFGNLDLVRKRLHEVQRQPLLTSNECPPTGQTPLHPPCLSLEYRASPSDT
jgi:hypothetical protein